MLTEPMYKGARVTVTPKTGPKYEGWLVGEIPEGILLALDEDLHHVRLVKDFEKLETDPRTGHSQLQYPNARELEDLLRSTAAIISRPLKLALERIDFQCLHAFCYEASFLRADIERADWIAPPWHTQPLPPGAAVLQVRTALRAMQAHQDVYHTFRDSGIGELLEEFGPFLAHLPPDATLPHYDLQFETHDTLVSDLEAAREKPWTNQRHQALLKEAHDVVGTARASLTERPSAAPPLPSDDSTVVSRWVGPSLRILAGTGLAAANAAIAITAGLTATIMTIGTTAVPAYVGVATSLSAGFIQAADGLEKLGRRK